MQAELTCCRKGVQSRRRVRLAASLLTRLFDMLIICTVQIPASLSFFTSLEAIPESKQRHSSGDSTALPIAAARATGPPAATLVAYTMFGKILQRVVLLDLLVLLLLRGVHKCLH